MDTRHPGQQGQECLQLGGEDETIRQTGVEKWLDAEAISSQHESLACIVVKREGEHAVQPLDEAEVVSGVSVKNGFAVGMGRKDAAFGLQFLA